MKHLTATSALLLLLLGLPQPSADTFEIYPDGSGDFATIQQAINASSHGDLIRLHDGIFTGDGNRDLDYRGRAITIRSVSADPHLCILDCQGHGTETHRGVRFVFGEGPGSRLVGVTIRNGNVLDTPQPQGGAIEIRGASPEITHCRFESNRADWGGAICLRDHASPEIDHCWFADNFGHYAGGALDLSEQCLPQISFCTFWRNASFGSGAALSTSYSTPTFLNCTFAENIGFDSPALGIWAGSGLIMEECIVAFTRDGPGILCEGASAYLACCDVYGNAHGNWISCIAEQLGLRGNIELDPLFCDPEFGELTIDCVSPCVPGTPPNEQCQELIGAWGVGCGGSPRLAQSWGEIKATFR